LNPSTTGSTAQPSEPESEDSLGWMMAVTEAPFNAVQVELKGAIAENLKLGNALVPEKSQFEGEG